MRPGTTYVPNNRHISHLVTAALHSFEGDLAEKDRSDHEINAVLFLKAQISIRCITELAQVATTMESLVLQHSRYRRTGVNVGTSHIDKRMGDVIQRALCQLVKAHVTAWKIELLEQGGLPMCSITQIELAVIDGLSEGKNTFDAHQSETALGDTLQTLFRAIQNSVKGEFLEAIRQICCVGYQLQLDFGTPLFGEFLTSF